MAHIVLKTELRDTVLQIHVLGIKSDVMLIY